MRRTLILSIRPRLVSSCSNKFGDRRYNTFTLRSVLTTRVTSYHNSLVAGKYSACIYSVYGGTK